MRPMMAVSVLSATWRPSLSGLPRADGGDQVGVLLHVRVVSSPSNFHGFSPVISPRLERDALGADDALLDAVGAALGLAAHAGRADAVRGTRTRRRSGRRCCRTRGAVRTCRPPMPTTFFGMAPDRPVDHVEVVHVLLDDVVAGEPGEVEPVAALPLHVGHAGLCAASPTGRPGSSSTAPRRSSPISPSWMRFIGLEIALLVAALRAGDDGQPLLRGQLGGGDDRADADRVDGHRLLHEDVLAGLDRGLQVDRAGSRAARR